jgi:hypothetical protein
MTILFEKPDLWTCELTDRGIFFVHILVNLTDVRTLDEFMATSRPHLERLQPVLYLNDATQIQDAPLTLQWRLAGHMKTNAKYIKRSAVFGLTPRKAFMVRSIVRASGRTNVKVCDTRAECERWLLDDAAARPSGDEKRSASPTAS